MITDNLTLQESLLLLCLNDHTGKFEAPGVRHLFNAAALAGLLRQRRIAIENGKLLVKSTATEDRDHLRQQCDCRSGGPRAGRRDHRGRSSRGRRRRRGVVQFAKRNAAAAKDALPV